MSDSSSIEWTDATWGPLLGCSKVSEGCRYCYAIREAWKKQHHPHPAVAKAYAGLVVKLADGSLNWTGRVNVIPERLEIPLRWKQPKRIFVNSMSDLFHESVSDEDIDAIFGVMALARHHTFQVLTKRPERMAAYFAERYQVPTIAGGVVWCDRSDRVFEAMQHFTDPKREEHFDAAGNFIWPGWPLPNVWLGTSVENQAAADERIPHLLRTPAVVRFLSCEPLLGPVELPFDNISNLPPLPGAEWVQPPTAPTGWYRINDFEQDIHWVIVGGESGAGARPSHPDWFRSLRDQCVEAGVAFHFKQWSGRNPKPLGRMLDGREWNQVPDGKGGSVEVSK